MKENNPKGQMAEMVAMGMASGTKMPKPAGVVGTGRAKKSRRVSGKRRGR